jgi:hypothetical protein
MNSKIENIRNQNGTSCKFVRNGDIVDMIFARRASISIEKQRDNKQIARRALTN